MKKLQYDTIYFIPMKSNKMLLLFELDNIIVDCHITPKSFFNDIGGVSELTLFYGEGVDFVFTTYLPNIKTI